MIVYIVLKEVFPEHKHEFLKKNSVRARRSPVISHPDADNSMIKDSDAKHLTRCNKNRKLTGSMPFISLEHQ